MIKHFISILIISSFTFNVYASEMLFYKNPTADNLINIINDFDLQVKRRADLKSYRHQRAVMQHYLTLVFQLHPDLIDGIITKINDYSDQMQERIAQSLINNNKSDKLPEKYQGLAKDIVDINEDYLKSYNSQKDIIHDVSLTDLFWMSYFVTGNEIYIEKILKLASGFSLNTRKLSYEVLNREQLNQPYNDIRSQFTGTEFNEIQACKSIMKSIVYNRQQYKDINEKVKALTQRDESMNYAKDF